VSYLYQVRIARDAERDIDALHSAAVPRIFKAIRALGNDPRPPGCKKLRV
jgi:mRNA-degrading endonuclease RelE of RelBE toxin-antitoxin system